MDNYSAYGRPPSMIESLQTRRSLQMSRHGRNPHPSFRETLPAKELRLLRPMAPGSDTLSFRSVTVLRARAPSYTAVSYTWGDGEATEFIYLDGHRFHVRPNLWSCLYYLSAAEDKAEWNHLCVDAICIDQTNDEERNAQVRLMDQTYRDATCVSVWLGVPNEEAFDWEQSWVERANRPYWSRVWVIQEFLLGSRVEISCGNHQIEWEDFRSIVCREAGIREYDDEPQSNDSYNALPLLLGRHHEKHPKVLQPLYSLLVEHNRSKCKDSRDRVFALLGLIVPEERELLSRYFPDYTLKEDHVIIITLAHLLTVAPPIAPQILPHISTDNEKLFLGLGVESNPQRKRLLRRAKDFYYVLDQSWKVPVQSLIDEDFMENFRATNSEDTYGAGKVESSGNRRVGRSLILMGLALGLGVLFWRKRR